MTPDQIVALDATHVWHPYAAMPAAAPVVVRSASGVRLEIEPPPGTRVPDQLIDAMSSWWAAIHGYRHPALDNAAHAQIDTMSHVMFGGLTHEPAVRLAARLAEISPAGLEHVFFSDSGSVSVEVAIKMCLQYWRGHGKPDKHRLMTWRGGYHGDTFHPMSVCDPVGGMHSMWSAVLPRQVFADAPPPGFDTESDPAYLDHLRATVQRHATELAAIIVEPVVQGAGGMRFHNPAYLGELRDLADEFDVLLIFDEIATGFGRTGALFAANHAAIAPDVMCVGKALTGGYLSLAATLCTPKVADGIGRGESPVLAHGPTFMANPLATSIAGASIDLLLADDWAANIERLEEGLVAGLERARGIDGVADVRVLGAIGVIEMQREVDVAAATLAAMNEGVWIRPFRNLIYTMPPFVCTDREIDRITTGLVEAARQPGLEPRA